MAMRRCSLADRGRPPASRRAGARGSAVRAAAVLAAAALLFAGPAVGAAEPSPPASPAFYTQGPSRVRDIAGDAFTFVRDDGKPIRVRLLDADSESLGNAARRNAQTVVKQLLEEAPFWVFPVGQSQGGAAAEMWADVWTSKGWLSQVLIRAGYAQRRTEPAPESLAPPDKTGTSNKGPAPAAPAFVAASCKAVMGDAFEIQQGDKKFAARLFDVTCENPLDATATSARMVGSGGVWVLPCAPQPASAKTAWPVRIWTAQGSVSDTLVRSGQAKRREGMDKPETAAAPKTAQAKTPAAEKTAEPTIEWRPIAVTMARPVRNTGGAAANARSMGGSVGGVGGYGGYSGSTGGDALESQVIKIATGVWRVGWEVKQVEKTNRITFQVYKCGPSRAEVPPKYPSSQVISNTAATGAQILRTAPGFYWIRVSGTDTVSVKVEEAYPKTPEQP